MTDIGTNFIHCPNYYLMNPGHLYSGIESPDSDQALRCLSVIWERAGECK